MIAFRIPDALDQVELRFFGYAMHSPHRVHDRVTLRPLRRCDERCYGCAEARREHDLGDVDEREEWGR